ncbi:MAG: serine hydrolase domain-containing protein [Planctomycetota bacterium]
MASPRLVAIYLLALTAASAAAPAQTKPDSLLQRYEQWGFSGAVLIAKAGKPVLAKGYGFAETAPKRRNTDRTLFEIASITKQFTAAAILKLEMMGKLSTEDPIHKHLPGVPQSCRQITIHHLLSHTSGVPGTNTRGHGADLERAVRDFCGSGPKHPVGKHWEYWNGGYALLAGIVERASGDTYMAFCRQHLFQPAGMKDTGFTGDAEFDNELDRKRAAIGTSARGPSRSALDHPYRSYGWQYRGMGGAVTTVQDLWKWDRALHTDKVLSKKARQKLFHPVLKDYAYGWFVKPAVQGKTCIQHGGGVRGFVSVLRRYPDDDACIAVVVNADNVPVKMIADNLESVLFGQPLRHPEPPRLTTLTQEQLAPLAGIYRGDGDSDARLVVRVDDGALVVGVEGQAAIGQLVPLMWPGWPADFKESNARAVEIVEAIARGDVKPLEKHMARSIPASWPKHVKDKLWPDHEAKHGTLESVRALGCCTKGRRVAVVLALEHKKKPSRVKIEFSKAGLQILDWNGPEFPITLKIRPVGQDEFVDFQWRKEQRFVFERKRGKVAAVKAGKARFTRDG